MPSSKEVSLLEGECGLTPAIKTYPTRYKPDKACLAACLAEAARGAAYLAPHIHHTYKMCVSFSYQQQQHHCADTFHFVYLSETCWYICYNSSSFSLSSSSSAVVDFFNPEKRKFCHDDRPHRRG